MKHTLLIVLGIVFFLSSCNNPKSVGLDMEDAIRIDVKTKAGSINFVDLMEDVRFIPLETSDSIPVIGEVSKIIPYDSDYYILDREKSKGLYRFSADGRFIAQIGRAGRGPGEYMDPLDFIVNSSGLIVLDHLSRQLLFYDHDGYYKKTVPMEYIVYEITGMQDENLIFAVAGDNRNHKEAKDYEILILDVDGKFVSAGIHNTHEMNFSSSSYSSFLYNGEIRYSKPLRNYIHSINQETVRGAYVINILDDPLPIMKKNAMAITSDSRINIKENTLVTRVHSWKMIRLHFSPQKTKTEDYTGMSL
jgi:hypothetical protein